MFSPAYACQVEVVEKLIAVFRAKSADNGVVWYSGKNQGRIAAQSENGVQEHCRQAKENKTRRILFFTRHLYIWIYRLR